MGLNEIKEQIVPVLKEAGVTRSSIFGSVARGEADSESDLDLLVEFPKGKSLFDLVDLKEKLEGVISKKVDIVTYKAIHPLLRDIINREQVQII